ncbi:hypothetical protein ACIA8K_20070 [Catenuloplanes sp. NPDC051500]|uniref:hypothetical protein n=1 Tax=Catenuloplanes sp. NPDC051500 TaxID=3363959 RepID=UPI0037A4FFA4
MGPNDAVTRRPPAHQQRTIDVDGQPDLPQPSPTPPQPSLIDFLDNRWRFAEASDVAARRAILLLTCILLAAALALILLVALLVLVGLLAGLVAAHLPEALLALAPFVTGGGIAVTIYRRRT